MVRPLPQRLSRPWSRRGWSPVLALLGALSLLLLAGAPALAAMDYAKQVPDRCRLQLEPGAAGGDLQPHQPARRHLCTAPISRGASLFGAKLQDADLSRHQPARSHPGFCGV